MPFLTFHAGEIRTVADLVRMGGKGRHFKVSGLSLADLGNARIVRRNPRDLFAGQLAGDGTHLLADVVAAVARLEGLQLFFEIGALLAAQ